MEAAEAICFDVDVYAGLDALVDHSLVRQIEQPGLRLTEAQASRLWRLDEQQCRHALSELTGADFLKRSEDGRYARPSTR